MTTPLQSALAEIARRRDGYGNELAQAARVGLYSRAADLSAIVTGLSIAHRIVSDELAREAQATQQAGNQKGETRKP